VNPTFDDRRDSRAAAIAAAALITAVAVLGWLVRVHPQALHVDAASRRAFDSPGIARHLGRFDRPHFLNRLVWFGSPTGVAVLMLVLVGLAWLWRDRIGIVLAVVGPILAIAMTELLLKPLVHRQLPSGHLSYPSGHATGFTAVVVVFLLLLLRRHGSVIALRALPFVALGVAVVGIAIVRLHYHYLTDVVGGIGVGSATVLAVAAVSLELARRVGTPSDRRS
jgi:undecaprenyl-diphosphatase